MTRHPMPRPGFIRNAFLAVLPRIYRSAYETRLERMAVHELMTEYEAVVAAWNGAENPSRDCEQLRLCRRVVARRLFASPGNAA